MTDYTANGSVTIHVEGTEDPLEHQVEIELVCDTPGARPIVSGPPEDCDPGWPAEFSVDGARLLLGSAEVPLDVTPAQLEALVGEKEYGRLIEAAEDEAINSGEF